MGAALAKSIGPVTVLSAVTTGTSGIVPYGGNCHHLVAYVTGVGTISAGTLLLEECYADPPSSYGGTWSQIASIDLTTLTGGGAAPAGKQVAAHYPGCFFNVRARLSVDVSGSGGAVTVTLAGA